ncbi:type I secretion membrane fusion protein, HlyD family [Serratia sp. FGI94]|uniref:HlyD family type I secretion periplasmic adaptor subunit n=1 Tax=Serratia sp. FGI94 TaxID=671990 RepID=UPI0002A73184|nr:HlyD family type I secretion periplasmic adaptor subunit [Serratia sp. FGI94]AGB82459.1 type I secretion membrane fusion protein, HlyD family [Serratia sp. FGI94]
MKINHNDFLPAVLEVQETPPSPLGRLIMWVVMALLLLAVGWAAYSEVDIVAVTRGKLAVTRLSRPVHTAVTANIATVLVQEGERVKKGQVLVELNSAALVAQREENLLRQRINRLHIARLDQLAQQYADLPANGNLPEHLVRQEPAFSLPVQTQLAAEIEADRQEKQVYKSMLVTLNAQLESYQQQHQMAKDLLPIYHKQYKAIESLHSKKMTSHDSLLEIRKTYLEASYNVNALSARVKEAKSNYQQKEAELTANIANKIRDAEKERVNYLNENALLSAQLKQLDATIEQYTLVAPIDGKVDSLSFRDSGAAVEAPQEVLKIVPENERLNAEVWVSNQDIGFLNIGQAVTVKIDAFDFTRYGWVEGTLKHLSADAIEDQNLGLVYKAVIELDQNAIAISKVKKKLEPGMSVSAEIKTGQRTVLSYLLSPMLEALDDVGKQR